ncbi:MAG: EAL domain-containing protein [Oscillospiraceae bacterium]
MKRFKISINMILTIVFCTISIIAVIFLMSYVQKLLNDDVRINLTEIVTKNKEVITGKIDVELNYLKVKSKQLSDLFENLKNLNDDEMVKTFFDYIKEKNDNTINFAVSNGTTYTPDGKTINVSARSYFKLGMEGTSNISNRLISRLDGKDIFIFCVPVICKNKVVGTVLRYYSPEEMYALCSVSLFAEKGITYIINSDGYILFSSKQSDYNRESDNYYRIIYSSEPDTSKQLEKDIKEGKSGFMGTKIDGENVFFSYTSIEQLQDWHLITSVNTDVVSPNSNIIIKMFYLILLTVVVLFSICFLYYSRLKYLQGKKLKEFAFVDKITDGDSFTKFSLNFSETVNETNYENYHLCSINIDNFKYINRLYGYDFGDKILKKIYLSYKNKLMPNEYISRISGDRFILLLADISSQRLETLIDFTFHYNDIKIYISAGIYSIYDPTENISLMVDKAEIAAKINKSTLIKKVTHYNETFDNNMIKDEQIKRSVEQALQNNEIVPFFQPKVDITTGKLIGAEALARWHSTNGEFISPGDFIPICEHTGLIVLVDFAIFEQTLKFIKMCLDEGSQCVPISINFSRLHLLNNEFFENIIEKLEFYKVPPQLIEIEITETTILDNYSNINIFIEKLHSVGLKVSMDDFGSGYSSLHMLKDIDIDVLKIDRNFLIDSINNKRQKVIFGTIIEMAKKLNIQTIVEGVETEENINLMKEFGCNYAQGFYFSRPIDLYTFKTIYKDGLK